MWCSFTSAAHATSSTYTPDTNANQTGQLTAALAQPTIVTQPADMQLQLGGTVRFSVVAAELGEITYQWQHDGTYISGATGDVLAVCGLAINLSDYGQYTVLVSKGLASARVLSGSDSDGLIDSWEILTFVNLSQTARGAKMLIKSTTTSANW